MANTTPPKDLNSEAPTRVRMTYGDTGLSISGASSAVIAALAVIGLIVISFFVIQLAEKAISEGKNSRESTGPPAGVHTTE